MILFTTTTTETFIPTASATMITATSTTTTTLTRTEDVLGQKTGSVSTVTVHDLAFITVVVTSKESVDGVHSSASLVESSDERLIPTSTTGSV